MPQIFTNIRRTRYRPTSRRRGISLCSGRRILWAADGPDRRHRPHGTPGDEGLREAVGGGAAPVPRAAVALGGQTTGGKVGPGLLVVVEGSDAGGKGGAIRRLVGPLDPRHYSVYAYSKPSSRELRHHFLWRFWTKIPGLGGFCVFDRSWYGRLLVERVEGFATVEQWTRGLRRDRAVRAQPRAGGCDPGQAVVAGEQGGAARRFRSRETDPFASGS